MLNFEWLSDKQFVSFICHQIAVKINEYQLGTCKKVHLLHCRGDLNKRRHFYHDYLF